MDHTLPGVPSLSCSDLLEAFEQFLFTEDRHKKIDFFGTLSEKGGYDTLSANVVNLFPKRYQNSDDQQDEKYIFSKIP